MGARWDLAPVQQIRSAHHNAGSAQIDYSLRRGLWRHPRSELKKHSSSKTRLNSIHSSGPHTVVSSNPDHIHVTGVPQERDRAVSLHLYGRTMTNFNIYDVEAGTRRRIEVAHNES